QVPFDFPPTEVTAPLPPPTSKIFGSVNEKFEEFTRAAALGLFDYLRKSRMRGFVVSLSGGADSAAVVSLVYLAIRLAAVEIGLAKVCTQLGYPTDTTFEDLMPKLLACVYQPTRNSSQTTRDAAQGLAEALHAAFYTFDVDGVVHRYIDMVGDALAREIRWETDDIALQNIQARARAPGVWMLANIRNALLLATSNRSEASVGYATMDGDTCGGLS
ncbi:MAG: NAD+ synthetase, partial [Nannocystaceae bacterium]